ncbi:Alpha/Beta hydrolase protein [Dunaliella salina]|uniref:Alpha/Beta hydrolase protein n=1 Tax=Dunaliella salina TaxID=3046 RepID=A0ABQ7GFF2_DUNSA|nr:Alpha/Beta hydrolase protein [Dunaliella salina]|eukprot:KAF5833335.1 Alpha/Beta hydrolase protein [Dunaliella salina]
MDSQRGRQEQYAFAGYFTVAIDCRYHGERQGAPLEPTRALQPPIKPSQKPVNAYQEALVRAWRGNGEHPFLLDNVFDIICCLDYLAVRPEVDMERVGITGVSLGGMHAWLTAVVDQRIAVTAPMIGVQGFGWAIHHNAFQARVDSIPLVFEAAARDMSKPAVDAEVVTSVWSRLLPGMLGGYDAPFSLPELFPRPLIVVNGELDPRCPMPGVLEAFKTTQHAYMRQLYLAKQIEKGEQRERQRKAQAEEDAKQQQAQEQREKERQSQPPDPRHAPAKPQRLATSKMSPGTAALITAETIASLPPALPIGDCEAEAFQECRREEWRLEAERAAEHAAIVEAVNALTALYVEPKVGHAETAGMHKAVKEFLDIHLKGPMRRQTLSSSTRTHLVSFAT